MTNRGLTTKQRAAIRALLAGATHPEAAAAAGVHENTIGEWLKNPDFQDALHQAESDAMNAVSRALLSLADKAAGTLEGVLDDPKVTASSKVRAADVVLGRLLQIKELAELEQRIARLEEVANG